MYNSILLGVKQKKFNKYSEAFNFFQSKSVNSIIASRKLEYVIHFRDLQIFDDQTQYFKRYYTTHETTSRTRKLIINMTPPTPNIIPVQNYNLIETNHRKHIKLLVMQEKSQARRNQQEDDQQEDEDSSQMILPKIDDSNFSQINSEKEEESESDSYDSQPFNAYEIDEESIRETGLLNKKVKDQDVISIKEIPDSFLVLDFKDIVQEVPKINVLPPVFQPPALPEIETVTTGMQTMPMEMFQPPRIPQKQTLAKTVIIPQLKKQHTIRSESNLQQRNELKKENMILTDSIEMVYRKQEREKQKSKPSTFMQYYNSQPVKAPSNILERYIKRKK